MFPNANNVLLTGGNFTHIINNGGNHDAVSTTLWQQIAPGAIFDSAERHASGKCHPGTRQRMMERMNSWIHDPDPAQNVLWLYGPAGSGKSALAHSVCELLKRFHPERYGGSFYFTRGPTDRGKGIKLFPTLAYQLAVQFPSMRSEINDALYRDPSLPTKSIDIQLFLLIIQPLLRCGSIWPSHTPTIFIDGLDECDEENGLDTQRKIIALISRSIIEHNVPLRFMIASRPEYWIRDAFEAFPLPSITVSLSLRDDVDADKDITVYLTENFDTIRLENRRVMGSVETPWPLTHIIKRFVEEASGQYIYASTVLKFVGKSSRFTNPQEQLRIITSPGPHRASAFSELDRLYATILSAYPRRESMKRVLGGLLVDAKLTTIEIVLGVDPAEITLVLDALSSLIDITEPSELPEHALLLEPIFGSLLGGEDSISFCHSTFREFLGDETRSGPFYVDVSDIYDEVTHAFFRKIQKNLEDNYNAEPHLSFNMKLAAYRRMMFDIALDCVPLCRIETLVPLIADMTQKIQQLTPSGQMEYPACHIQDMSWIQEMLLQTESRRSALQELEEPDTSKFLSAISELRATASSARRRGIQLLSACSHLRITPTLIYIKLLRDIGGYLSSCGVPVKELFILPGNIIHTDTLSTLQQHRHILYVWEPQDQEWVVNSLDLGNNSEFSEGGSGEGWLSQAEWRNQQTLLAYELLNSLMNNVDNDLEFWEDSDYKISNGQLILEKFFNSSGLLDICTEGYFRNPYTMSMLGLILDSTAWTNLLPLPPIFDQCYHVLETATSIRRIVFCWINRQLKNPRAVRLIEDYDRHLLQKMVNAMREIFQHCFLQTFKDPYFSELVVSTRYPSNDDRHRSIIIGIRPFSIDFQYEILYSELEPVNCPLVLDRHIVMDIQRIHDELFGNVTYSPASFDYSRIKCSDWHPHLAAFLLNVMVKYQYCRVNPGFFGNEHAHIAEKPFSYIVQCLPYAHTTQQNLDTFRALGHLCPRVIPPWCPPVGFCSLSVEFLTRYEPSILSSEELGCFKKWLFDLEVLEVPPVQSTTEITPT